jgi:hypothetical protein
LFSCTLFPAPKPSNFGLFWLGFCPPNSKHHFLNKSKCSKPDFGLLHFLYSELQAIQSGFQFLHDSVRNDSAALGAVEDVFSIFQRNRNNCFNVILQCTNKSLQRFIVNLCCDLRRKFLHNLFGDLAHFFSVFCAAAAMPILSAAAKVPDSLIG